MSNSIGCAPALNWAKNPTVQTWLLAGGGVAAAAATLGLGLAAVIPLGIAGVTPLGEVARSKLGQALHWKSRMLVTFNQSAVAHLISPSFTTAQAQIDAVSALVDAASSKGLAMLPITVDSFNPKSGSRELTQVDDAARVGLSLLTGGGLVLGTTLVKQYVHTPELESAILAMVYGATLTVQRLGRRL